jgi:cell wall-associated NlpC family hydrolase
VRASLALSIAGLDDRAAAGETTDVVRELYQQGDEGVANLATVMTLGPDGMLERLYNLRAMRGAANQVVRSAEQAEVALEVARVTRTTAIARLRGAMADREAADLALRRTQRELVNAEAQLARLGLVAPQVEVGPEGCPTSDVPATLRDGAELVGATKLCTTAIRRAATPQAALAITWAFQHLGAAYACGGTGRMLPFRADCSSFVSRAYAEGAGLATAGDTWAPSTRNMVPWDGVALDRHYAKVSPAALRPGDLVLYDTCPQGGCPYKHVVMYLGQANGVKWMLHTNSCGDVAKVERFWGFPAEGSHTFLVARRVLALPGEKLKSTTAKPVTTPPAVTADAPVKRSVTDPIGAIG